MLASDWSKFPTKILRGWEINFDQSETRIANVGRSWKMKYN